MFAGAAREAVFSKPEVIRRVKASFIPVALKAALVNNPPSGEEGGLYREIARSKPAPQGICAVNSAGKVLDWALMFDNDPSVTAFLDHVLDRFAKYPDARKPFSTERYMRFPSAQLDDMADSGRVLAVPEDHGADAGCPAQRAFQPGTLLARVIGRAVDRDGKLLADTLRQESYVEDRFEVPVNLQEDLARMMAAADQARFRIPDALARLIVGHAYLGQIDVNPVGSLAGGREDFAQCEMWGQRTSTDSRSAMRIDGHSHVKGGQTSRPGQNGDGRAWEHEVELTWEGSIEMQGIRVARLLLLAHGSEHLTWGSHFLAAPGADVTRLPGGHPINLACGVRYGITAEPMAAGALVAIQEAAPAQPPAVVQVPDEARRQLIEALGPPFVVFHPAVQEELKLSGDQKQQLDERLLQEVQEAMQFFQGLEGSKPEERQQELEKYRRKTHEGLAKFSQKVLKRAQLQRLHQVMLQREDAFALLNPEISKPLNLTDEQRMQLMATVQELQKRVAPLVEEAQTKGNPEEIRPKVVRLRAEYARKLEAILNETQAKQWKEMLGKPIKLDE